MRTLKSLMIVLAVAASAPPALAQTPAPRAPARTAAGPATDVLPDVTIKPRRRFPDDPQPPVPPVGSENVIVQRMPRLIGCFTADTWSPDPTAKFNQAYYEELTGEADYFEKIRTPAPKVNFTYSGAIHAGDMAFATRDSVNSVYAATRFSTLEPFPQGRAPRALQTGLANCANRGSMEKDVTFARGLAMFDKGEYDKALAAFEEAYAKVRNSQMAGEIALMIAGLYQTGRGAPRDVPRAIEWLKKAVGAPLSGASGLPGQPGRSRKIFDPTAPGRYYNIASEAAMKLSVIYFTGGGVPKDDALARYWVETAVRHDHVPAMKIAADMYYTGFGGRRNLRNALLSYELAAGWGHPAAAYAAGQMHELGEATRPDRARALAYYGRAALSEDPQAALALAIAYDTGNGVKADPKQAVALYRIAAVAGHPKAQTALGTYFYEGGVVEKNPAAARAWFQEASIRGDPDAMVNLAAMLIKGEGGEADPVKAWAWLSLARKGGRQDVAPGLASLEHQMKPEDMARARALVEG